MSSDECIVPSKTACVIGAGLAGLVSLKCLLDASFDVTCFEINKHVGGRWHEENNYPIPRTTITNLPNYMSCYSDYPLPSDYPLYLSADQYCDYFQSYAKHFQLLERIKFQHEVIQANPIGSYSEEKTRWRIKVVDKASSEERFYEFDCLIVASGFYSTPYIPERISSAIKGFTGKIIHSIDYKDAESFKDKNVVVCGFGNTGGDIAVETSRFANKTIISTSHGSYVVGRLVSNGEIPIARSLNRLLGYVPGFFKGLFKDSVIKKISNHVADINRLRLEPKSASSVTINDEILNRISYGKIQVRKGIKKIVEKTVYFDDGVVVENVDVIVLCTGYVRKFSFLDEKIVCPQRNGKFLPLYKGVFPVNYNQSLAFVGMFSVFNSVALTAEMQARYVVERFKGRIHLPKADDIRYQIDSYVKNLDDKFNGELKELNMIMDPFAYYDELADEIGCRPSLTNIFFTDPVLFWHLSTKYSFHEYRLTGPNKWDGARDAIINQEKSTYGFLE